MLNWKTLVGTLILVSSCIELFAANIYYRTGRLDLSPLTIGAGFLVFFVLGIILIKEGTKRKQIY